MSTSVRARTGPALQSCVRARLESDESDESPIFCSEDGVFLQTIHNLGANGPGILLAIVSMVEDGNVND